jgi:type II secretory pathway component PulF
MAWYLIQYLDEDGKKQRIEVEAPTEEEAVRESKIRQTNVLKVGKSIKFGNQDLPLETQELILSQIRALVFSGQTINMGVEHMLNRIAKIKPKAKQVRLQLKSGGTVSEVLTTMGLSKAGIALVRSGEASGRLSEALDSALSHVKAEKAIKAEVSSPFTEGITIVLIATGMLMGLPGMIAPAMNSMADAGLNIETNFLTDMLLFINDYNAEIWYVLLGIIVGSFVFRKLLWKVLQNVPGFRVMKDFFIIKRSVLMLMVFSPLFSSGISLSKALEIIKSSMSSASDNKAVNQVVANMRKGMSFSAAINDKENWAPLFYNSFSSFEQATFEAQMGLIESVTDALLGELKGVSKKIATTAGIVGKFLGFLALMMMIGGYYFPSLTAST